jgi:ATP-dependent RNA helicase DHX37/DHR1
MGQTNKSDRIDGVVEETNSVKAESKDSDGEVDSEETEDEGEEYKGQPLFVLPLYSLLPTHMQMKVFEAPPAGHRLCVLATNVAETSLTIPNIKYVIDCGRVKEKKCEVKSNIQHYEIEWVSKASAEQRAGRAGRTGPGHCYRLYSSAVYDQKFELFSRPEIQRTPIEGVILQMKSMHIDNVVNFPFPTSPNTEQIVCAEKLLKNLEALDEQGMITTLGRKLSQFPLNPRLGKMLLLGQNNESIIAYVIIIASILSVGDFYVRKEDDPSIVAREYYLVHQRFEGKECSSDILKALNVIGCLEYELSRKGKSEEKLLEFCSKNYVRVKAIKEIMSLKEQIIKILKKINKRNDEDFNPISKILKPPTDTDKNKILQIVLSCFIDQVARRVDDKTYKLSSTNEIAYLHNQSAVNTGDRDFVVYQEIQKKDKLILKGITVVPMNWIGIVGKSFCSFGNPVEKPSPRYDAAKDVIYCHCRPTFGNWELDLAEIEFPDGLQKYRYFLKFLLQGDIIRQFKEFTDQLTSKPELILRPWAQSKIYDLLTPLSKAKISTRKQLIEKWQSDKTFLLRGFLHWIPSELHSKVKREWPFVKN